MQHFSLVLSLIHLFEVIFGQMAVFVLECVSLVPLIFPAGKLS